MKNSFAGIDWLRFLLALYLVAYHTISQYPGVRGLSLAHLFCFGGFATSTFFILSGFVLTHVYLRKGASAGIKGGAKAFLVRRFANIYPIHLFSLVLIVASAGLSIHSALDVVSIVFSPESFTPHTMTLRECIVMLILQLTLLQAWYPYYLTFNYPAWSLSTLAFFYVAFPFVSIRLLRCRRTSLMLLAVWMLCLAPAVAAVVAGWHGAWMEGMLHVNPLFRLPEFLAGILAYKLHASTTGNTASFVAAWRLQIVAAAATAFLGAAYLFEYGSPYWKYLLHNGALLPVQVMLILACATTPENASDRMKLLSHRLGNAALSLFVLHAILFKVFNGIQKLWGTHYSFSFCMREFHTCMSASHYVEIHLRYFPLFLCMAVVVSVVFQERVVGPVRQWIEAALLSRRRMPVMAPTTIDSVDPA